MLLSQGSILTSGRRFSFEMDGFIGTLESMIPIAKGEEITVPYINILLSRDERQHYLRRVYGFNCQCEACALPEEQGTVSDENRAYISAMKEELKKPNVTISFERLQRASDAAKQENLSATYKTIRNRGFDRLQAQDVARGIYGGDAYEWLVANIRETAGSKEKADIQIRELDALHKRMGYKPRVLSSK